MKRLIIASQFLINAMLYASWPLPVCTDDNLQLFPSVAKTSNSYITAFVNNNTEGKHCEIYAQRFTDNSDGLWGSALIVSADTVTYYHGHRLASRVIPGSGDTVVVAWINHKNNTLCAQKIRPDGGRAWNQGYRPIVIGTIAAHTLYEPPQVCSDGSGGAIFVRIEKTGGGPYVHSVKVKRINSSGGVEWDSTMVSVSVTDPKAVPITMTRICARSDGGAMVTWVQFASSYWRVYLRSISSGGVLGTTVNVDQADWAWYSPYYNHLWTGLNIARTGDTNYVAMQYRLARVEEAKTDSNLISIITRERICTRVVIDGQTPSARKVLDELTPNAGGDVVSPYGPINRDVYACLGVPVMVASSSGAYVAWERGSWSTAAGFKNDACVIKTARITSSGDTAWVKSIKSGSMLSNRAPKIIADGSNALVVWQNMDGNGGVSSLYKCKLLASGPDSTTVSSIANHAFSFGLTNAGSGNAVVVWSQNPGWDIYAKKFSF